jgi:hypothetical protein
MRRRMVAAAALVFALLLVPRDALERSRPGRPAARPWTAALQQISGEDDVVLADFVTNMEIPAYAGKVVAWPHPLHWVRDHDQRRADLDRFFRADTDPATRDAIIRRHRARFVAVGERARLGQAERAALASLGRVVFSEGTFFVVDLKELAQPSR